MLDKNAIFLYYCNYIAIFRPTTGKVTTDQLMEKLSARKPTDSNSQNCLPFKKELDVYKVFQKKGFRRTKPREKVLKVFFDHHLPLSMMDVKQKITDSSMDKVSVYRTIDLLCRLEVLTSVGHWKGRQLYELTDEYRKHHHHLVCEKCGAVEDVESCHLKDFQENIQKQSRFKITKHEVKFSGLCESCQ